MLSHTHFVHIRQLDVFALPQLYCRGCACAREFEDEWIPTIQGLSLELINLLTLTLFKIMRMVKDLAKACEARQFYIHISPFDSHTFRFEHPLECEGGGRKVAWLMMCLTRRLVRHSPTSRDAFGGAAAETATLTHSLAAPHLGALP